MTNLEIVLSVILYAFLAVTVYRKQMKVSNDESNKDAAGWLAIFAPLTVLVYAIRAVFFEDWI